MQVFATVAGVVTGLIVAVLLFKPVFKTKEEFFRCVKFWLTPDIVSMLAGKYSEDWISEAKLGLWMLAASIPGFLVYATILVFAKQPVF